MTRGLSLNNCASQGELHPNLFTAAFMKTTTVVLVFFSLAGLCHGSCSIPTWCANPSGSDCSWYRKCLERRYPCSGKEHDYAIAFGEKYCNRFGKEYDSFNGESRRWIDATRKCLQQELAPILRENLSKEKRCQEIYDRAFASHINCYVQPESGSDLSVCNLSETGKIFGVVKGAFLQMASQVAAIARECIKLKYSQCVSKRSQFCLDQEKAFIETISQGQG